MSGWGVADRTLVEREESEIGGPLSEIETSLPPSLARLLTRLVVAAEPPPLTWTHFDILLPCWAEWNQMLGLVTSLVAYAPTKCNRNWIFQTDLVLWTSLDKEHASQLILRMGMRAVILQRLHDVAKWWFQFQSACKTARYIINFIYRPLPAHSFLHFLSMLVNKDGRYGALGRSCL